MRRWLTALAPVSITVIDCREFQAWLSVTVEAAPGRAYLPVSVSVPDGVRAKIPVSIAVHEGIRAQIPVSVDVRVGRMPLVLPVTVWSYERTYEFVEPELPVSIDVLALPPRIISQASLPVTLAIAARVTGWAEVMVTVSASAAPLPPGSITGGGAGGGVNPGLGIAAGLWRVEIMLGGADVTPEIIGDIRIEAGEDAARIADLAISRRILPDSLANLPLIVSLRPPEGEERYRLFTGVIDTARYESARSAVKLTATDGLRDKMDAMPNAAIDALIGGAWSENIFNAEASIGWQRAMDLLSTTAKSLSLTASGQPRVTSWNALPGIDYPAGQVEDGSLVVEAGRGLSAARKLVFSYRYSVRAAAHYSLSHSLLKPGQSFGNFIAWGNWLLPVGVVEDAISSTGASIRNITYALTPPSGAYGTGTGGNFGHVFSWTNREGLALGVSGTLLVPFSRAVTVKYEREFTVVGQSGKKPEVTEICMTAAEQDENAWEERSWLASADKNQSLRPVEDFAGIYRPTGTGGGTGIITGGSTGGGSGSGGTGIITGGGTGGATGSAAAPAPAKASRGTTFDDARAAFAAAFRQVARAHLADARAGGRQISFTVPLDPAIDLGKGITVSDGRVSASGVISGLTFLLSPESGRAVAEITALAAPAVTGITVSAAGDISAPVITDQRVPDSIYRSAARFTYDHDPQSESVGKAACTLPELPESATADIEAIVRI